MKNSDGSYSYLDDESAYSSASRKVFPKSEANKKACEARPPEDGYGNGHIWRTLVRPFAGWKYVCKDCGACAR